MGGLVWNVGLVYAPYDVPTPDCWVTLAALSWADSLCTSYVHPAVI